MSLEQLCREAVDATWDQKGCRINRNNEEHVYAMWWRIREFLDNTQPKSTPRRENWRLR